MRTILDMHQTWIRFLYYQRRQSTYHRPVSVVEKLRDNKVRPSKPLINLSETTCKANKIEEKQKGEIQDTFEHWLIKRRPSVTGTSSRKELDFRATNFLIKSRFSRSIPPFHSLTLTPFNVSRFSYHQTEERDTQYFVNPLEVAS